MRRVFLICLISGMIFSYGIVVGKYQVFPYRIVASMKNIILGNSECGVPTNTRLAHYHDRVSHFSSLSGDAEVVMLGDSLTDACEWHECLKPINILNRGISGDTSLGVLERINEIIKRNPKWIFIMIGRNDFSHGLKAEQVFSNYKQILDLLSNSKLVVQSTLYVRNMEIGHNPNFDAVYLNSLLIDFCNINNIPFLDLNAKLGQEGQLSQQFTNDGIHLNGEGYRIWCSEIRNIINQNQPMPTAQMN